MTIAPFAIVALLGWPKLVNWPNEVRHYEWVETVPGAASSYRLRYSRYPNLWCTNDVIQVPLSACFNGAPTAPYRCIIALDRVAPSEMTFVVVTKIINGVETETEHGPVANCP